jgi:hypothetical protein
MKPNKIGKVVKFQKPYPDEDPNQHYVVLEIHFDVEKPRALIKELNGGRPLASTSSALVDEPQVVEVDTSDFIGYNVTINEADYFQATGMVVKVSEQKNNA